MLYLLEIVVSPRSLNRSGSIPPDGACIVICARSGEADQIGRCLSHLEAGCLLEYEQVSDLVRNVPAGEVDLVVLAADMSPMVLRRTLKWIKGQWRRCMCVVVSKGTCRGLEIAARECGALYLDGPVRPKQWDGVLCGLKQLREAKLTS